MTVAEQIDLLKAACQRGRELAAGWSAEADVEPIPKRREELQRRAHEASRCAGGCWPARAESHEEKLQRLRPMRDALRVAVTELEEEMQGSREREAVEWAIEAARSGWHRAEFLIGVRPPGKLLSKLPRSVSAAELRPLSQLEPMIAELERKCDAALERCERSAKALSDLEDSVAD